MVRWHRDVDAEYGDCNFICTILFAEPAAEDPMLRGPQNGLILRYARNSDCGGDDCLCRGTEVGSYM